MGARSGATRVTDAAAAGWRSTLVLSRVLVGFALILGGVVWAAIRVLHYYGLSPADIGYDLDQPPVLLVVVGVWLIYRSGPR